MMCMRKKDKAGLYNSQPLEKSSRPYQILPVTPVPGPSLRLFSPLCPLIPTAAEPEK